MKPKSGAGKPKSSKFRGVSLNKSTSEWVASISVGRKCFAERTLTEEEAAHAYDRMAVRWLRGKARTNFPLSEYEMPELPPVVSGDGIVTSAHVRAACHQYILVQGLVGRDRMPNWTMVNNLFFSDDKMSQEWVQEWCLKLGIDPRGEDL